MTAKGGDLMKRKSKTVRLSLPPLDPETQRVIDFYTEPSVPNRTCRYCGEFPVRPFKRCGNCGAVHAPSDDA